MNNLNKVDFQGEVLREVDPQDLKDFLILDDIQEHKVLDEQVGVLAW